MVSYVKLLLTTGTRVYRERFSHKTFLQSALEQEMRGHMEKQCYRWSMGRSETPYLVSENPARYDCRNWPWPWLILQWVCTEHRQAAEHDAPGQRQVKASKRLTSSFALGDVHL